MKNLLKLFALTAVLLLFSCSGTQPKDVAEEAVKCTQNRDFEGLVDLMIPDKEENQKDKAMLVGLMEEKGNFQIDKKGGIKSYEIGKQEIDKKKGKASVEVEYLYGNGTTAKETLKFRKEGEKWYLSM